MFVPRDIVPIPAEAGLLSTGKTGRVMTKLPDILVTNLHRRFTGVSATVQVLVPFQQTREDIAVLDTGGLGLPGTVPFRTILRHGWSRPVNGNYRIWHARRDVEMLLGLFLKYVLFQRWKLVFTSAAPKRHGRVLRFIMNRMDAIIATSERAAGFLDWHSAVVPHGVDVELYQPADKAAAKAALGLSGLVIGNFGRIRASKGTDLLIAALCKLLPEHPDVTVVITGEAKESEADYLKDLQDQLDQAGVADQVQFWGHADAQRVRQLYQACDLVIAASRTEGFGLTPLEAMASGAAVLTSGAGYWPELVTPEVGARFETGDAEDLTAKLRDMVSDPDRLARMGQAGRHHILDNHAITGEVDGIFSVYDTLR